MNLSILIKVLAPITILAIPPLLKTSLGPDEKNYLHYGEIFFSSLIYEFVKGHPLTAVFVALINSIIENPLRSYQLIYFCFSMLNYFGILAILKALNRDQEIGLVSRVFICLCPGTYFLGLYATTHIIYSGFLTFYIFFVLRAVMYSNPRQINNFIIASFLGALLYYTRLDGLITVIITIPIILILSLSKLIHVRIINILVFITIFLILIIPWHYYLMLKGHFISPVIYGGWQSNIWIDGPMKYLIGSKTQLPLGDIGLVKHILLPFGKNTVLFSQSLGSLMLFPIFLWPLIGFGLFRLCQFPQYLIIILIPLISCLSYIIFYVETRYLIPATLPLTILCLLGINEINKNNEFHFLPIILVFLLSFVNIFFAIGWIN